MLFALSLLGARLLKHLKTSLDIGIHSFFLWSDSEVVLHWINSSSRRFKVFVAQRLGEIQDISDPGHWRYVPSKLNIPVDVTKVKPIDFSANSSWLKGPQFLQLPMNEWPQKRLHHKTLDPEEFEIEHVHGTIEVEKIVLPDATRFSNWNRILRTTAWVLRFVSRIKNKTIRSIRDPYKKVASLFSKRNWSGIWELQPDEISKAEL